MASEHASASGLNLSDVSGPGKGEKLFCAFAWHAFGSARPRLTVLLVLVSSSLAMLVVMMGVFELVQTGSNVFTTTTEYNLKLKAKHWRFIQLKGNSITTFEFHKTFIEFIKFGSDQSKRFNVAGRKGNTPSRPFK